MFDDIKKSAKLNLKGSLLKSFGIQTKVFLSFFLFILSSFTCTWFIIVDTSLFASIGIFNNVLLHISVCAFAVIENIILFCVYLHFKLRSDAYFFCMVFPCDFVLNTKKVIKYFSVYVTSIIFKLAAFFIFFFPCAVVSCLTVKILENGISRSVFAILTCCFLILFLLGVYYYSVFICKYSMLSFVVLSETELSVFEIFRVSQKLTDGKCKKLFKLKLAMIPKYLICMLIFPCIYYLPYCKILKNEILLENKKPYMRRSAHTEKSVVFYFEPVKEN